MNKKSNFLLIILGLALLTSAAVAQKSTFPSAPAKKMIELGWDKPSPQYARDHIAQMEKAPLNGVVLYLPGGGSNVFDIQNWPKEKPLLESQSLIAADIHWQKFTDNFIRLYAKSSMDWFSDADWEKVLSKLALICQAAKAARCKGLVFDGEPYGFSPWGYSQQKWAAEKSNAEYAAKVYQRGQQFMNVMQKDWPDFKLLVLSQYIGAYQQMLMGKSSSNGVDVSQSLYIAFLNGMLDAAGKGVEMIDGNEAAYYYTAPADFYQAYWMIRQGARNVVPDNLKAKYDQHVRAASALYVDQIFDMRDIMEQSYLTKGMTPQERSDWFEQNAYYALQTSDEYVWLYSEKMNWWTGKGIPDGLVSSIAAAKTKVANNQELGYDMTDVFLHAKERTAEIIKATAASLQRRSATIPRLSAEQIPHIDGILDEKIYQSLPWLDTFIGFARPNGTTPVSVTTRAFVAYNAQNLYIAFRCDEPNMKAMNASRIIGNEHDSDIWHGDSVDMFLLKPGQPTDDANAVYYHFILNPANTQWDSLDTGIHSATRDFQPKWQSAVHQDAAAWNVEIAIPWKEIGITNAAPGLQLHLNLTRKRGASECSSWSQFLTRFQEPENFGVMILGKN